MTKASSLLCLILLGITSTVLAQSVDVCAEPDAKQYWESGQSPIYAEATALAKTLDAHGINVKCVRSSKDKKDEIVVGQKGAAAFVTSDGEFNVIFLPESETFDGFRVTRRHIQDGFFMYSSAGSPQLATGGMQCRCHIFFLNHHNVLFMVLGNKKLATRLRRISPHI